MSQSPRNLADADATLRYGRAWLALNTLLRQGMSFSGRERHRCFLNIGSGAFANVSSASGLDLLDDGRASAAVDWDFDGDLDLWTTNSTSPRIRYLANDNPRDHHFLALRLQGSTSNRDAIGARVELYLRHRERPRRIASLRAGDGFLSQTTKWIHFGLGDVEQIDRVVVRWPGGKAETFDGLEADRFWYIIEGSGRAIAYECPASAETAEENRSDPVTDAKSGGNTHRAQSASPQTGRVVLLNPIPLPELSYHPLASPEASIPLPRGRPLLLGLWTTWCAPCIAELTQWSDRYDDLTGAGLSVMALCVDQRTDESEEHLAIANVQRVVKGLRFPFGIGMPQGNLVPFLDIAQRTFTPAQRPLPLPCSFLIDARGRLAVIYKGPVSVDQVLKDSRLLDEPGRTLLAGAVPFDGKWLERPLPMPLRKLVLALYEAGQTDGAKGYLSRLIAEHEIDQRDHDELAQLYRIQGAMFVDEKSPQEAAMAFRNVLRYNPRDARAHLELGNLALLQDDLNGAERHLNAALQIQPKEAATLKAAAALRVRQGQTEKAIALFEESLAQRDDPEVHFALANALIATRKTSDAVLHLEAALRLQPGWPPAANNLAWILATSADRSIRDGDRAVELAAQACRATNHAVRELLLTYGAALAEVGRFDQAVSVVQSAVAIAQRDGDPAFISKARSQLNRYRNRQPLRPEGEDP